MKTVRHFTALTALTALCACNNSLAPASPAVAPATISARSPSRSAPVDALFVASSSPYFVDEFALPLSDESVPEQQITNVNEPVPLATDPTHLYVGSFDDGLIYTYPLPLSGSSPRPNRSAPSGFFPGIGSLSGLAVEGKFLYVAGEGRAGNEVRAFQLPLVSGQPTASLGGFNRFDFLGIAAGAHVLYVASTTAGTVAAYKLPLQTNESPEYTITTALQDDGATGVAVNSHRLYVSLLQTGEIYAYALPYRDGGRPLKLNVRAATGGENPYGIAVGASHLFVTAGSMILSYPLPISSHSVPDTTVPFTSGSGAGIAIGK
jgi:hypothetical protein